MNTKRFSLALVLLLLSLLLCGCGSPKPLVEDASLLWYLEDVDFPEHCYHIPRLTMDTEQAQQNNTELLNSWKSFLSSFDLHNQDAVSQSGFDFLTYEVGSKDGVLTIVIHSRLNGVDHYEPYVFSAETGAALGAEEVLRVYGLNPEGCPAGSTPYISAEGRLCFVVDGEEAQQLMDYESGELLPCSGCTLQHN